LTSDNDNKTASSSIKSENLQELWKILDENSSQYSHRDDTKSILKQQQKGKNVNKNEFFTDQLSARGEKKTIQNKTTNVVKDVKKGKIRNYNIKNDT
jgi:hypothetical protein